MEAAASK